jgi:hypothetical protein
MLRVFVFYLPHNLRFFLLPNFFLELSYILGNTSSVLCSLPGSSVHSFERGFLERRKRPCWPFCVLDPVLRRTPGLLRLRLLREIRYEPLAAYIGVCHWTALLPGGQSLQQQLCMHTTTRSSINRIQRFCISSSYGPGPSNHFPFSIFS